MPLRTRIALTARQHGMTSAEIARKLHFYPSNLSAMDAGKRSVSLKTLGRIARILDCSLLDLVEVYPDSEQHLFRDKILLQKLRQRDLGSVDGSSKGWIHANLLAWQRHFDSRGIRRR